MKPSDTAGDAASPSLNRVFVTLASDEKSSKNPTGIAVAPETPSAIASAPSSKIESISELVPTSIPTEPPLATVAF